MSTPCSRPGFPRRLPVLLMGAVALVLATACGCGKASKASTTSAEEILEVEAALPKERPYRRTVEQPGRIEAFERAPLYAYIPGKVEKVNVEIGTRVRKNDVLAELWVPEREAELEEKKALVVQADIDIRQAEEALKLAGARVETAQCLIKEAKANRRRVEADHAYWKSQAARFAGLVSRKVLDEQTRDETLKQFRGAEAQLELAGQKILSAEAMRKESEAGRDKAEADLKAARNRLKVAEAAQHKAAAWLEYAHIRAPFDGVVSQRHVDPGHVLVAGASSNSNNREPLFIVVRTDRVRIFVEVPETDAVLVENGARAVVRVQALNDREFEGKVAGSSWALDPGQRTLRVEIDLDNRKGLMRPHMYAYTSITVDRPAVLALPARAVLTRDGETFCYFEQGGKAVRTPLRIGARMGAYVEVLKKKAPPARAGEGSRWLDFSGRERVICTSAGKLRDGQQVSVKK